MPIAHQREVSEQQRSFPELPDWLRSLAPAADGEEAVLLASAWNQYHKDLCQRVERFVGDACRGVGCRVAEVSGGKCGPATFFLDPALTTLTIQDRLETGLLRKRHFWLADLRNLLVCADSELARRVHRNLSPYAVPDEAKLACLILLDGAALPVALVLPSSEAREDFLDCMAVLIIAHRQRHEASQEKLPAWLPQPGVAGLRPPNGSLRSGHLMGPLASWLGSCAPALPTPVPEAPAPAPLRRRNSEGSPRGGGVKVSAKSRSRARSNSESRSSSLPQGLSKE